MKKLKLVVSLITESNYLREQAADAQTAAKAYGSEVEVLYANSDPVLQSQQLLQRVQSKSTARPDAILVEPVTRLGLPRVAEAAVAAGIAWIVNNAELDYMQGLRKKSAVPVFSVTQGQKQAGVMQAMQVLAMLPNGGSVLYIQGPASTPVATERAEGMVSTIGTQAVLKTVRAAQLTPDAARQAVTSWLRLSIARAEDFDLIACQSNDLAVGAKKAFEENTSGVHRTRWLSLPLIGIGAAPQSKSLVDRKVLTSAVITPTTMARSIEMLVPALADGTQPAERTVLDVYSYPKLEDVAKRIPSTAIVSTGIQPTPLTRQCWPS